MEGKSSSEVEGKLRFSLSNVNLSRYTPFVNVASSR